MISDNGAYMDPQRNVVNTGDRMPSLRGRQRSDVEGGAAPAPSVREQNWPGTLMAFGIFIGLFTLIWMGARTFVPVLVIFRFLAVMCVAGTLLPYVWTGLRFGMAKLEWFLFNVLFIGPVVTSLLVLANHFVHDTPVHAEQPFRQNAVVEVMDEGGLLRLEIAWSSFGFTEAELASSPTGTYRVGFAKGCFGYWSVVSAEAVTGPDYWPRSN
jgi:hypothetical protein